MRRQLPFVFGALAVVALAIAYIVSNARGFDFALLAPAGPIAGGERQVMLMVALFSSLVIVPVFFLLFYFAWKYRATAENAHLAHQPNWDHDSPIMEFSWWFVPGVIIAILAAVCWRTSHTLDPYVPLPGNALTVQVIALDWKWLFVYPEEGVASVNQLEIPAGRPVHFVLTADAPMNSFWIPQLGGQIMVVPGMSTQLYLEADKAGIYKGYSANISGEGFAGMTFDAHAVSQADFDAWVATARGGQPLTFNAYAQLVAPSQNVTPTVYVLQDSSLYDDVMSHYILPPSSPVGTGEVPPLPPMNMNSMQR